MCLVVEKNRIDLIECKITIMQQLEQVYVSRMGRESYKRQLLHLVNQLPGMHPGGGGDHEGGVEQLTLQSGTSDLSS